MIHRREFSSAALESLVSSGIDPVLARCYAARGVEKTENVDLRLTHLLPLRSLRGTMESAERLRIALEKKEKIMVIGDYDADGATGTALAVSCLRDLGASVDFLLPNRFTQGYGLSPDLSELAKEWGAKILLTVDNGISAIEGVARAKKLGMDVIVTDHHIAGEQLPDTAWIINPNHPDCTFQSKSLCGVGVVYYLMSALWKALLAEGKASKENNIPMQSLDLVALGTVADLVPLDANNRRMVHGGLLRIRKGISRVGLQALIQVSGMQASMITEMDLGYRIAPRLNAAGRLDDMRIGVNLLLEQNPTVAMGLAQQLDDLNKERRAIQKDRMDQADSLLNITIGKEEKVIVVKDPNGHEGVVGLVAGNLKEKYHRPSMVFAPSEDPQIWKGSARSVLGVHLRDFLATIDAKNKGMIHRFGGHAMAAGLTVMDNRFDDFVQAVQQLSQSIPDDLLQEEIYSDGPLDHGWISLKNAKLLAAGGPWGMGFPEPQFDTTFRVISVERIGATKQTRKLSLANDADDDPFTALQFQCPEDTSNDPVVGKRYIFLYKLNINHWAGKESLQLIIDRIFPIESTANPEPEESESIDFVELDEETELGQPS